jgi:hypothetical protein
MNERFGIPDHSPQHAPDHSLHNPTPSSAFPNIGGSDAGAWPAPASGGGGYAGPVGPYVRPKRSVVIAVVLAFLLGPLGLFYVNILSGIAALLLLPPVVRALAFQWALAHGTGLDGVYQAAVPILWCIAIPWAVIGVKIRNARIARAARD